MQPQCPSKSIDLPKPTAVTLRLIMAWVLIGWGSHWAGQPGHGLAWADEKGSESESSRPNILFLFGDDQRSDTIAAWGNDRIKTPNLDALVRSGISFRRNYCFGSRHGAVCQPSRAMLMSGRHLFHIDDAISNAMTFPQLLRQHGYTTFAVGKWHNGLPSLARSFAGGKSIMMGGMSDHTRVPLHDLEKSGELINQRTGEKRSAEMFADAAVEFLSNYRSDDPFLCYVAFTSPHDPRDPPESDREYYYQHRPSLPNNFLPQHPFDNGQLVLRDENLAPWPRTTSVISDQLAEYYGMITHLDAQIGRVLQALHNSPFAENTIVIYAADHGLAVGSHGLLGKQSLYEHSMQCPLIMVGPGIAPGTSTYAMTYLYDIFPTICDFTHVTAPDELDGKSLAPIVSDPSTTVRDSIMLAYRDLMRAVRDDRWKLIVYPQINHRQLFDLAKDPDEMHDLAASPSHQSTLKHMANLLQEWQTQVGDTLPWTVSNPRDKFRDLTGTKRTPDQWQPRWIVEKYFEGPDSSPNPVSNQEQ
ncbi:MAG: sulfatase-like hydrolase/transferase [Pirellulaceae bacterium]